MERPADVFDRESEWAALERFIGSGAAGTTLGLVYGRRRQGKTFLLQGAIEAHAGFYFQGLRQSDAQNLQRLAESYRAYTGARSAPAFRTWDEALEALLALGEERTEPVPIVVDELPYLLDRAPHLPSLLQALLGPRSEAVRRWRARLILCGSALSTMRGLLAGSAPLRGRASMELMVHPFGYRDAAAFWEVTHDPDLAVRLHALVGGTAAYRDMCGGSGPQSIDELGTWLAETLLNPASAMFREGNVLLAEEERITDTATYFGVLTAISQGRTRRGEIAAATGRTEGALAHPLAVLTEARLVAPLGDVLRQKRTTYHVAEPILRFHQLVIAPNEGRPGRHQAAAVWEEVSDTVASRIYGPHFKHLARVWCDEHASTETLGGIPGEVGVAQVACRRHRTNHELDVVVSGRPTSGKHPVLAIGEAKWRSEPCDLDDLHRLEHLHTLLALPATSKLLLFSRSGFTFDLLGAAAGRSDVELVDLGRLYEGA